MASKKVQDPKQKLINSLNRIQGQIKALEERLEALDWQDDKQVKQLGIQFKAAIAALESSYERFKDIYFREKIEQTLSQLRKILH